MKRRLSLLVVVIALLAVSTPGLASSPVIDGEVSGVEICQQAVCGAAIFIGVFHGVVDDRPVVGFFSASVKHDPLPDPLLSSMITGGNWGIFTPRKYFRGGVLNGSLLNNDNKTFTVDAVLGLDRGGTGIALFSGLLNHNVFPPTIEGNLFQP